MGVLDNFKAVFDVERFKSNTDEMLENFVSKGAYDEVKARRKLVLFEHLYQENGGTVPPRLAELAAAAASDGAIPGFQTVTKKKGVLSRLFGK